MGFTDWMFGATPGTQAGQAVKEVVTGVFDGLGKIIDEFHTSDEEKVQMKIAVAEQKLKAVEIMVNDVQNARAMQMQTRSVWPGLLSLVVLVGFFGGGGYILVNGIPSRESPESMQIVNMFAVALMNGLSGVLGYWLGSSAGSDSKNQLLYQSTPAKKE